MKKFYSVMALLLCICMASYAQRKDTMPFKPFFVVSFLPSATLEPDPSANIQLLYRASEHLGIAVEGGWIYKSYYNNAVGFRIRPEARYYKPFGRRSKNFYLGVQGLYKRQQLNTVYEEFHTSSSGEVYSTLHNGKAVKSVFGLGGLIGFNKAIDKKKRFWFDAYIGAGLRNKDFIINGKRVSNDALNFTNYDELFTELNVFDEAPDTQGFGITFLAGIRLGIKIN